MNIKLYLEFRDFIIERENIRKKKVSGLPPPWTNDELLSKYKFTNIWRQDDKVTQDISSILNHTDNWKDVVLTLLWARIINRSESLRMMQPPGIDVMKECFEDLDNPPVKTIYNDAYIVLPNLKKGTNKIDEIKNLLLQVKYRIDKMPEEFPSSEFVKEEVYGNLCRIKGLILYEMMCDWWQWSGQPEYYCNVGGGAEPSLKRLFPDRKKVGEKEVIELLVALKEENIIHEEYGELTMRCVEGALCEFRKYNNLISNPKSKKRLYKYEINSVRSSEKS